LGSSNAKTRYISESCCTKDFIDKNTIFMFTQMRLFMKHLAQTIKALSDPIRLRIVLLLQAEGELCVCDLMAVLKAPQSTVSRHLAYLKRSCWVDIRREGVWMYYSLSQDSCDICNELLQTLKRHASNLPEAASDRAALSAFLKEKPIDCS
jgi:ArsR family transcriptional regulator